MTHFDPNKNVYETQNALFTTVKWFIKELRLIDQTPRPIMPFSRLQPFQPIEVKTKAAMKPESVLFSGSYIEHWNLNLN